MLARTVALTSAHTKAQHGAAQQHHQNAEPFPPPFPVPTHAARTWLHGGAVEAAQRQRDGDLGEDLVGALLRLAVDQHAPLHRHDLQHHAVALERLAKGACSSMIRGSGRGGRSSGGNRGSRAVPSASLLIPSSGAGSGGTTRVAANAGRQRQRQRRRRTLSDLADFLEVDVLPQQRIHVGQRGHVGLQQATAASNQQQGSVGLIIYEWRAAWTAASQAHQQLRDPPHPLPSPPARTEPTAAEAAKAPPPPPPPPPRLPSLLLPAPRRHRPPAAGLRPAAAPAATHRQRHQLPPPLPPPAEGGQKLG